MPEKNVTRQQRIQSNALTPKAGLPLTQCSELKSNNQIEYKRDFYDRVPIFSLGSSYSFVGICLSGSRFGTLVLIRLKRQRLIYRKCAFTWKQ